MAEILTVTRFFSALKVLFPEKKIQTFGMDKQPWWAFLNKIEKFGGRKAEIPIQYSPGGAGSSHTFEDAQSNKGSALYTHFEISRRKSYKLIGFDSESLEASEGDDGAYMEAKTLEIEAALKHLIQMLAADLQGDGTGTIATVASVNTGTNTFVVGDADIVHFENRMRIQAAATPFSALRSGGPKGYMTVGSVDFDSNTITLDVTSEGGDTLTQYGMVATDRVYPKGNFGLAIDGTESWIPEVRTGLATPFNAVTRSVFPSRLAGIFFDASTYGLLEGFERAYARAAKENTRPGKIFVSNNVFTAISLELGAKAIREPVSFGQFGFDSIVLNFGGKKVNFIADQNFRDTTALCAEQSSWGFRSLKKAPRILTRAAGVEMLVEPAADGYEMRFGWKGNQFCRCPGDNMRIKLPAL